MTATVPQAARTYARVDGEEDLDLSSLGIFQWPVAWCGKGLGEDLAKDTFFMRWRGGKWRQQQQRSSSSGAAIWARRVCSVAMGGEVGKFADFQRSEKSEISFRAARWRVASLLPK